MCGALGSRSGEGPMMRLNAVELRQSLAVEAARVSMAESEDRIPYADGRRGLGLDDEQKAERKRARPRAKTI